MFQLGLSLWQKAITPLSTVCKKIYRWFLSFFTPSIEIVEFKNEMPEGWDRYEDYEEARELQEAFCLVHARKKPINLGYLPCAPKDQIHEVGSMEVILLQSLARKYLARQKFFLSKSDRNLSVFRIFQREWWGSPMARTNVIGFQATARGYLAREKAKRYRERLLNICRNVSLPDEALTSAARRYLATRRLAQARKEKERSRQLATSSLTAFPALGDTRFEGCGCWDYYPEAESKFDDKVNKLLFGKWTQDPKQLVIPDVWILKELPNDKLILARKVLETFFIYEARSCHLQERELDPMVAHHWLEIAVIRPMLDEVKVLGFQKNNHTQDLSSLVEDQHVHVSLTRSFIDTREPAAMSSSLKLRGNQLVTAEEKARIRREERKARKEARARGEKVKGWQVPARFKGLTTQEYHEARRREQEDLEAWVAEKGRKALPQAVQEWLKSRAGSEQWNNVHAIAVSRPDMAEVQLKKINSFLRTIGLKVDLKLNTDLIARMTRQKARAVERQQQQLKAAEERVSAQVLAKIAWDNAKRKQIERTWDTERSKLKNKNPSWAVDDEEDEGLPSLADWGYDI